MADFSKIKNIIWDFDGTLCDTYPAIARSFQKALRDMGYEIPIGLFHDLARKSMQECLNAISASFAVDQDVYLENFYTHYRQIPPGEQPPFAGAIATCAAVLRRGGVNLLATHRRRESAVRLLQAHGMDGLFADCIFGDDGYAHKPDPEMFNILIEKHSLKRDETLAIGDRALDIEAGKAAGIAACLYISLEGGKNRADQVIVDYEALMRRLSTPEKKE